ncbi:hypothetical protein AAVH_18363 [Aphelenchoides avenae]|nr:hypothetical protein AAVH_18363 [Aphelenchus avenae]
MTPKHDKNGTFYQWPALIRKVDKEVAVFTFFPLKTKEILMSDERHNILPFPAKHVGKMIEEASELSPDLAEALRDTQSYLDNMTTKNAPPSPKKTDNKPTSAEGSKPKKGEKSKSAKAAPKAASPDSLDLEIERQIEAMPDARNKGKEQPAKQVTKEPAKQAAKEPAKAKPKSPPKPKRGGKKRQHEEEQPHDDGEDSKRLKEALLEEDAVGEADVQPLDADARAALLTYITSDQAHVRLQDIWWGTRTSLRHERFQYPETYGSYTSIDFDHGGYLEQWDQLDKAVKQCWEWMELNKEDAEGKVELDIFNTPGRMMSYVARVGIPEMAHKVNFELAEKIFNKTSKLNPQPFDDEENGEGFWEDGDPHNGGDSNGTEGSSGLMELARVAKGQIGSSSDEQ